MAITVATITNRLKRMFPEATTTTLLEYLQYANRELCFDLPLYTLEETITLDGTSRTFALNENDLRVWEATYWYSATRSKPLRAYTKRGLELKRSGWRNSPSQEPTGYAVYKESDVLTIQLDPLPSTATSGGYPKVVLRVSRHVDLTSGGNLPVGLVAPDVYTMKAACMYASDHDLASRYNLYYPQLKELIVKNLQGFDFAVVDAPKETLPMGRFPGVVRSAR